MFLSSWVEEVLGLTCVVLLGSKKNFKVEHVVLEDHVPIFQWLMIFSAVSAHSFFAFVGFFCVFYSIGTSWRPMFGL